MKRFMAVCVAAFALSASAFAEEAAQPAQPAQPALPAAAASQCPAASLPADPTLPNGATANARAMQAGDGTYRAWVDSIRPAYDCRRSEYLQAVANLRAREAEFTPWNDKVRTVSEGWQAQAAAYNARAAHH